MKTSYRRFIYAVALLLLAGYAYVTLRGPRGVNALFEKQRQIREMEQRNAVLLREVEQKRDHIRRLETNPAQQELEIRERLKLVRKGEKVFIIGDDSGKK